MRPEVVGVVVGQVQVVETGFLEQVRITFRHTEGIVVGLSGVLGAFPAFTDHALQVAGRQVGIEEELFYVGENVRAVVLRQADGGIGGTHHDVAAHGDRQQRVGFLGRCSDTEEGKQQGQQGLSHHLVFFGVWWAFFTGSMRRAGIFFL